MERQYKPTEERGLITGIKKHLADKKYHNYL